MTRQTVRFILIALSFLGAVSVKAADIAVSQAIDRSDVTYEGEVGFEIRLQWTGSPFAYRFDKPLNPVFDRLKVERFSSSISSTGSGPGETTTKTFKYTLVPVSSGIGRIEPVTISYVTWPDSLPGELITEALTVSIAPPVKAPTPGHIGLFVWIGAGAILAGAAAVVIWLWLRRRKPKVVVKTPVETFLESLTALKREAGSDLKKFEAGLFVLLTEFLSARYGVRLKEYTAEGVIAALSATNLTVSQKEQIARWLVKANADKFMPVTAAPGDTIRLESEIREFFGRL